MLTLSQVERVVRAASGEASLSARLVAMPGTRALRGRNADRLMHDARISRSLVVGMTIFAELPSDGTYSSMTTIALSTGLSRSTVHRYLATLVAIGLAERNPRTREYRIAA
jgi:Fic family protein